MRYKTLSEVGSYVSEKINVSKLRLENYISTENMISNRGGISLATKLPSVKTTTAFQKGDILISNIRPYFKKIWLADKSGGCSNDVLVIRSDSNFSNRFLYYVLSSDTFFDYAVSTSKGTKMPRGDKSSIMKYTVPLFSLEEQELISDILKSYDEKIQLNKQINHHLEELAQAIFKSWFIDFEPFDGIKPSDWEIASLTDIADYLNGLAMQKFRPEKDENSLPVLKIKELRQGAFDKTSDICSANIKPEYIINDGDVIFSWSGSLLVDFWTGGIGGLNQHLFKVSSQNYDKWFYYSWTKYYLQEFINIAADKATTMGHITRSSLENAKILIPNAKDYEMISSILVPIYDDIIQNRIASRKLAQLRDEILPKLLSGELSINYNTK
ncbi:restriction endonuclease subunit S [Streptococcus equi]|uniref:restriction endonuclease subunit S n=1 Tax=Streptococcus equi TaxID=1336 RepID=UPI001E538629|nr:restriction endonuclease subunit S [Streptococcus equi]MCD3397755.1 restriction endonuclease subunit S [Streptococcus equi subsp. zooepidemicus]HEL0015690.1 restriction endonuclease subunit S [Streptococcus equi subsp. zooepidemicus]HEL0592040.1 restriction endonuclease subunit S [Streptococcus equi subsp. zooepidemicus]